ncbi:MAG: hypothetical protein WEC75_06600 [Dehalococcoidia bacterium]
MIVWRVRVSVFLGLVSFALAGAAAYLLVWIVVLTAVAVDLLVPSFSWSLRVSFAVINTMVPTLVALLVLVTSAVRLSAWRGLSPWPALAVAGLLAGVAARHVLSDIDTFNCFAFGASLTESGVEACEAGIR